MLLIENQPRRNHWQPKTTINVFFSITKISARIEHTHLLYKPINQYNNRKKLFKYWIKENHSPHVTTATKMQTSSESTMFPRIPKHTTGFYIVLRTLSHILCYGASHFAVQITKEIFIYALTRRTLRTIINGSS